MLYTRNDTHQNVFGFAVSYLNSELNTLNFQQKLKKFVIERELARAVNLIQILQFWLDNFFSWFFKYGTCT